jgi:EmrB/QacA subfamily drug resistance transporter
MNQKLQPRSSEPDKDSAKWKALVTVAMGTMMATMDASITTIAFPVLTEVFSTELTTVMWVTVAFILVCTSSMLVFGKISDLLGRRRIYALGMGIFTAGLLACALAQSMGQLIFFRTLQALGAAMTIACGTAIVTEAFPLKETGRGLGLLGVSVSLGFVIGPVLGGLLLHYLDWRSLFYIRAPVGLLTLVMALTLLRKDQVSAKKIRLDLLGILTSSLGLFSVVLGVSKIKTFDSMSFPGLLLMAFGVASLMVFIAVESRAQDPLLGLSLFKDRVFSGATLALFLLFLAAPPFILIMPFYLMHGLGLTPAHAGLLLAVHAIATIVFGPISGWLSDRFGASWFAAAGALAMTAAFCAMRTFDLQTPVAAIIPVLVLLGMGIGSFQPPNNSTIMTRAPRDRLGTASALIATIRQVGLSLGMALGGAIYTARSVFHKTTLLEKGVDAAQVGPISIPLAYRDVLLVSIFFALLVVFCSLSTGKKR